MAAVKFEQAMARLEAIVNVVETSAPPPDKSPKIFEAAIRLSNNCLKILDEAEPKAEVLVQDKNGKKRIHAYSTDDDADEPAS